MAESPAEELRRAARLMRERAEGADSGPWRWAEEGTPAVPWVLSPRGAVTAGYRFNVEHIASWHPGVALAVAALLETAASCSCGPEDDHGDLAAAALAVACAFLGEGERSATR